VETLREAGFRCGMTGDGVNDAPALKRADVGIAVSGSTDAARAASDIVLTGEGLSTIIDGIRISREIFARLKNFISYRIAATMQLLTFFFVAVFAFPPEAYYRSNGFSVMDGQYAGEILNVPRLNPYCPTGFERQQNNFANLDFNTPHAAQTGCPDIVLPICERGRSGEMICQAWPAFFQLPVLMLMLITLLNDGALISVGYDIVRPSADPERWNLHRLFLVAVVMAAVAMGSSLLLLGAALDSNNPEGTFAQIGIPPMEYGKIVTMIYLKVSLSDFLTLFSCRTQELPFWAVRPGKPLMVAVGVSLGISTLLATFWPEGNLDGLPVSIICVPCVAPVRKARGPYPR
jgi:H+-transporting ATPase